jgi:hypothetical protein
MVSVYRTVDGKMREQDIRLHKNVLVNVSIMLIVR